MTDETKEELQKTMDKLIDEYNETLNYWNSLRAKAEKWRKQGLSLVEEMKGEDESTRASLHLYALDSKNQISRPWDILHPKNELEAEDNSLFYTYNIKGKEKYTHLLHDSGRIGVFLKGFFGYNSNPNFIEFLLWLLSLCGGLLLWARFYMKKTKAPVT